MPDEIAMIPVQKSLRKQNQKNRFVIL